MDSLTDWFDGRVARHEFSGAALAVHDGAVAFEYAGGTAHRGHGIAVDRATRFAVASITKIVTAVTALRLVERGMLDLDGAVRDVLPPEHRPRALDGRHTLRQLLGHTSGLANYHDDDDETWASFTSCWDRVPPQRARRPADLLPLFADLPAAAEPGSAYRYGDANYILAGLVVEAVTGRTFADVATEEVLATAGLVDTAFVDLDDEPARLASHYYVTDGVPFERWRSAIYGLTAASMPDGGMITTPADLVRLVRTLLGGALLGEELVTAMRTPNALEQGLETYGLGLELTVFDGRVTILGHGGSDPGVSALVSHYVDADTTVAVTCNLDRGSWPATQRITAELGIDDPRE